VQNFALKFGAIAEKSAKNTFYAAPGRKGSNQRWGQSFLAFSPRGRKAPANQISTSSRNPRILI